MYDITTNLHIIIHLKWIQDTSYQRNPNEIKDRFQTKPDKH